jgi:predicted alpha/beta hydrolase
LATRGTKRAAVLAPGGGYSTDGPLLMYAGLAVERRGGYVHRIAWTQPLPRLDAETHAWVASQVAAALDETAAATGATARVVIGKSLGSLAAPLVADRGLAAVWFTPLLTDARSRWLATVRERC